jgi:hypothetical protein
MLPNGNWFKINLIYVYIFFYYYYYSFISLSLHVRTIFGAVPLKLNEFSISTTMKFILCINVKLNIFLSILYLFTFYILLCVFVEKGWNFISRTLWIMIPLFCAEIIHSFTSFCAFHFHFFYALSPSSHIYTFSQLLIYYNFFHKLFAWNITRHTSCTQSAFTHD